jgi:hypothetical protein
MFRALLSSEAGKMGPFCGGNSLLRDSVPPHPKNKTMQYSVCKPKEYQKSEVKKGPSISLLHDRTEKKL